MSEWISVKDRLPIPAQKVLIYVFGYDEIEIAYRNDILGSFWFYPENNGWSQSEVSHWCEPPKPPEET